MVEELVKEGRDRKGASLSESGEAVADRRKCPTKRKAPEKKSESTPSTPSIFTRTKNASLEQRIEILDWHHTNGKNQSKTAKHFAPIYPNLCIKQPLISAWLKDETRWRQRWAESEASHNVDYAKRAKRAKQVEHPEVDEMLELWVAKAMRDNVHLSGEILHLKWMRFADLAKVPLVEYLSLSDGWLTSFKKHCGLREFKCCGEAASADPETVEKGKERVRELIKKHGYHLKDI
ncbi:unnamed protein product [Peniophora sp. CBMAI 1063]|nr:unnamed protein product [Peniophora sp. CBMAI 1063]